MVTGDHPAAAAAVARAAGIITDGSIEDSEIVNCGIPGALDVALSSANADT